MTRWTMPFEFESVCPFVHSWAPCKGRFRGGPFEDATVGDGYYHISSEYGNLRTLSNGMVIPHSGIDIVLALPGAIAGRRTPVIWDGIITEILREDDDGNQDTNPWGNWAAITLDELGWHAGFAHMARLDVTLGQRVKVGDSLGPCDSTGKSTGPHWHFQVSKREQVSDLLKGWLTVDPIDFLRELNLKQFGLGAGNQDTTRAQVAMIRLLVQAWRNGDPSPGGYMDDVARIIEPPNTLGRVMGQYQE